MNYVKTMMQKLDSEIKNFEALNYKNMQTQNVLTKMNY